MKNHVSEKIALSVLKAIFSAGDVKRLSKLRGVILCGYPGCGKSTIARLLQDAFKFKIVSTDQIRVKELFKGQKHRQASEHEQVMMSRYLVYEELSRRINKELSGNSRVVVDGTNLDSKRFSILGAMQSKLRSDKMALVVIRTPEWIIKKRFIDWSKERYQQWWSVYKYWKDYVKKGKAGFPKKAELSNVQIIKPKHYSIRTFDWVSGIKAIGWDLDGTLYSSELIPSHLISQIIYQTVAKSKSWTLAEAKKEYNSKLTELGSNTKTLYHFGVNGVDFFTDVWDNMDLEKYLKKDQRLIKMFQSLQGMRHFILSNSNRIDQITRKLKLIGLNSNRFEKIFSTVDIGTIKPDPKPFKVALRAMNLQPKEVLYVGDRIGTDIRGAQGVGMRGCLVWGVSREANVSLKNVYEVAGLFGKEV